MQRKYLAVAGVATLMVLAAIGAAASFGTVGAQSTESPADRTITVSATGDAADSPDKAVVRVAATAEGDDPATVRDDLTSDAESLRNALDELGVEYETIRYSIEENRHPRPPERETDRAPYAGIHAYEVTLENPDDTGAVIDAAADSGAEVMDVKFTLSEEKQTELRNTAIENAMDDARAQADAVADAGDLEVTEVSSVDASQRRYTPVRYEMEAADGAGSAAAATVVESGDVSVSYTVNVAYNATTA